MGHYRSEMVAELTDEELEQRKRERQEERLRSPEFRLEALEHRVAHVEEFLHKYVSKKFKPLKNEDLL